jgi:DNA-binding response OmpR family regulator
MSTPQKKRILLVDDHEHLLVTLGDYLTFENFEVATATSGEKALVILESMEPDLIVLDISMPGMGGAGFLAAISAEDGHTRYPVLVFSALAAVEKHLQGVEVDGILYKPCAENDLVDRINDILESRARDRKRDRGENFRVLLAEDDDVVAGILGDCLARANFQVHRVSTGTAALERAAESHPDALVVKHTLPNMRGSSVVSLLSTMSTTRGIPVVLYGKHSQSPDDSPALRAVPEGVARFVTSDDPDSIVEALRRLTDT